MFIVIIVLFFLPLIGFAMILLVVCMLATWEWGNIIGLSSLFERILLSVIYSVFLMMILFLLPKDHRYIFQPIIVGLLWSSLIWWFLALFLVFFYPSSSVIWRESKILRLTLGMLIIFPFFCGMLTLRSWNYDENYYSGALWVFYIMLLVFGVDSGSYIFGKLFGKSQLIPKVSPRKTWQGFFGGLITASVISWSYTMLVSLDVASCTLIICSFISILASVLGDLTESMFKRDVGIKDSGYLVVGHGGVLDRIDSLTAAVPVFTSLLLLLFGR